jgi:hypothetical protein
MNQKTASSYSLESYHPYLLPQKNSKNPQIYYIHSNLTKKAKSHFGFPNSLGVKFFLHDSKYIGVRKAHYVKI